MIGQSVCVPDDATSLGYFEDRGFEVRIEERDLHAEYMARGEPGRASFFVERQPYYCVDLLRDGVVVAKQYAHGVTAHDALEQAKRRFGSEQE